MSGKLLVLRPRPGADETAARARELGLAPVVAPLFQLRRLEWEPPEAASVDAVILTSANAPRHGGTGLTPFLSLPCYCVGEATAAAAAAAGFSDLRTGPSDGAALVELMRRNAVRSVFHPTGRDRIAIEHPAVRVTQRMVYAAEAVDRLPPQALAAMEGAVALIHSARAGATFAALLDLERLDRSGIKVAAISPAAAGAAGEGWRTIAAATQPREAALLELAAKLCNSGGGGA